MTSPNPADEPEATNPPADENLASEEPEATASSGAESEEVEEGEASPPKDERDAAASGTAGNVPAAEDDQPPLPAEPLPGAGGPPLPNEPAPPPEDDGWDCQWDPNTQAWFFYNRFTGKTQWDNPRVASGAAATVEAPTAPGTAPGVPQPPTSEAPAAGGYNPAIHGDYDPNAWYAKGQQDDTQDASEAAMATAAGDPSALYGAAASFNRFTGQFQTEDMGPGRHSDEAKSRRQMNAYFDVDAAANSHNGRSLKAERTNKKISKSELKAFKEKRRAKKEEKRRAWLRD